MTKDGRTDSPMILSNYEWVQSLVWRFIRRYNLRGPIIEELKSSASLALIEAAKRFNEEINPHFTAFAYSRINGAMKDYLREEKKNKLSLEAVIENEITPDQTYSELLYLIFKEHSPLANQEKEILYDHYFKGETLRSIADKNGRDKSWATRKLKGILCVIRESLGEELPVT